VAQTDRAVDAVHAFLGGPHADGDGWRFAFGEHLESNWGSVYGGAIAAGILSVARLAAPGRSPRSLHLQIPRAVPRGAAAASASVRHAGRTVGTVEVELLDAAGKLCALALVTMVTPDAVAAEHHDTTADPFERHERLLAVDPRFTAPVQQSLQMLTKKDGAWVGTYAANVRPCFDGTLPPVGHITLPWDDLDATGPEAACLGADAMIAAPMMYSSLPTEVIGANPDLTLRFTTAPATREVLTAGTVLSVQHGTTTVALEVQAGDQQLAHGLATALLLPPRS
jgi:acyl-coenzyme A thioesterase PaaI-like protein